MNDCTIRSWRRIFYFRRLSQQPQWKGNFDTGYRNIPTAGLPALTTTPRRSEHVNTLYFILSHNYTAVSGGDSYATFMWPPPHTMLYNAGAPLIPGGFRRKSAGLCANLLRHIRRVRQTHAAELVRTGAKCVQRQEIEIFGVFNGDGSQ